MASITPVITGITFAIDLLLLLLLLLLTANFVRDMAVGRLHRQAWL
jgi:hypothetical protein